MLQPVRVEDSSRETYLFATRLECTLRPSHSSVALLANACTTRETRVHYLTVASGGTCDVVTILFSPALTARRWPSRKLQPTRPLVTTNWFHTRASPAFTILAHPRASSNYCHQCLILYISKDIFNLATVPRRTAGRRSFLLLFWGIIRNVFKCYESIKLQQ